MLIGLIKWFDTEKGFGAIGTYKDGNFFLHTNVFLESQFRNSTEKRKQQKPTQIARQLVVLLAKNQRAFQRQSITGSSSFYQMD